MIIEPGTYVVGCKEDDIFALTFDGPQTTIHLPGYELSKPVTFLEWGIFIRTTGYHPLNNTNYLSYLIGMPSNQEFLTKPVVCVSQEDALTYCQWKKGDLPSAAELEVAFRQGYPMDLRLWSHETLEEVAGVKQAIICGSPNVWFMDRQRTRYPFKRAPERKHLHRSTERDSSIGFCVRYPAQGLTKQWVEESEDILY